MPYCQYCGAESASIKQICPSCGKDMVHIPTVENGFITGDESSNAVDFNALPPSDKAPRVLAAAVDAAIVMGLLFALRRYQFFPPVLSKFQFFLYLLPALYLIFRDGLGGKSVGKLLAGITVVNVQENRVASIGDSFLRNCLFAVIAIPGYGWVGGALIAGVMFLQVLFGNGSRFLDAFAKTRVVGDRSLNDMLQTQ